MIGFFYFILTIITTEEEEGSSSRALQTHLGLQLLWVMHCCRNQRTSSEKEQRTWKLVAVGRMGGRGQEVHSRELSKFKEAMGVFSSWRFTWEWAWIKVSAGWPKSQRKKRQKTSISNTRKLQSKTWKRETGWSGWGRGGKGGNDSERLLSLHPSHICSGRERSAHCNVEKDTKEQSYTD